MVPEEVVQHIGPRVGIFVGGTTEWKLETLASWGALANSSGSWCHVGRVNTARRIRACIAAGALSFDGTSVAKFPSTLELLDRAARGG
jgi:hypothetical protein